MSALTVPAFRKNIQKTIESLEKLDLSNPSLNSDVNKTLQAFDAKLNALKLVRYTEKVRGRFDPNDLSTLNSLDDDIRRSLQFLKQQVVVSMALLDKFGCSVNVSAGTNCKSVSTGVYDPLLLSMSSTATTSLQSDENTKSVHQKVTPMQPDKHLQVSLKSTEKGKKRLSIIPLLASPAESNIQTPTNANTKPKTRSTGVMAVPKTSNMYSSTPSTWPLKNTLHVACGLDAPITSTKQTQTDIESSKVFRSADGRVISPPKSVVWRLPPKNLSHQESQRLQDFVAMAFTKLDGYATSHGVLRCYFSNGTSDVSLQTDSISRSVFSNQAGNSAFSTVDVGTETERTTNTQLAKENTTQQLTNCGPSTPGLSAKNSSRKRRGNRSIGSSSKRSRPTTITETDGTEATFDLKPNVSAKEKRPATTNESPREVNSNSTVSKKLPVSSSHVNRLLMRSKQSKKNSPPSIAASPTSVVFKTAVENRMPAEVGAAVTTGNVTEPVLSKTKVKSEAADNDVIFVNLKKGKRRQRSQTRTVENNEKPEIPRTLFENDIQQLVRKYVAETVQSKYVFLQVPQMQSSVSESVASVVPVGQQATIAGTNFTPSAASQFVATMPQGISMSPISPGFQRPGQSTMPEISPMPNHQIRLLQPFLQGPRSNMPPPSFRQNQMLQISPQCVSQQSSLQQQQMHQHMLQQHQLEHHAMEHNRFLQTQPPLNAPYSQMQPRFQQQPRSNQRRCSNPNTQHPPQSHQQLTAPVSLLRARLQQPQAPQDQVSNAQQPQFGQCCDNNDGHHASRINTSTYQPKNSAQSINVMPTSSDPVVDNVQQFVNEQIRLNRQNQQ